MILTLLKNPATTDLQFEMSEAKQGELEIILMDMAPLIENPQWEIQASDAEGNAVPLEEDIHFYENLVWTVKIGPDATVDDFLKDLSSSLAFRNIRSNFDDFSKSLKVDPNILQPKADSDVLEEKKDTPLVVHTPGSKTKLTTSTSIGSTAQIASIMLSHAIDYVKKSLNESITKLTAKYDVKDRWATPLEGQNLLADLMVADIESIILELTHIRSRTELEKLLDDFEQYHSAELEGRPDINEIKRNIASLQSATPPEQKTHSDPARYEKLSCKDAKGKTQHFLVEPQKSEGGEATIYFGYRLDAKNKITNEKIVIRKFKFKNTPEDVDLEIKATQVLYKNTSERLTFKTADGIETYGFVMEELPGKDFMKKREHSYTTILIHKTDEEKINQLEFEDNQLVLSKNKIYWRENGRIESYSMEDLKGNKILYANLTNIFPQSKHGSSIADTELIKGIQIQTKCTSATGLDESEFEKLNLSFLQRCQILKDIFEQLSQLHKAKFFHGDVNPANIKIYFDKDKNAHAKLFDFGQSRFLGEKTYLTDHVTAMMQDFIPPETVGERPQFSLRSDIFSMAGIMGMIFSKPPNLFIQSRLAKSRTLEKSGAGDSEVMTALAKESYNVSEMFKDVDFHVDAASKKELEILIQLMTNPIASARPSSENIFKSLDKIVRQELAKIETLKSLVDSTLNETNTRTDIIVLDPMKKDFMNQSDLIIHSGESDEKKNLQLSALCDRFKEFCNIAYRFKDMPYVQPGIVDAYKRGDNADLFKDVHIVPSFVPPLAEKKTVNKDQLEKTKTWCIKTINSADNIGTVLAALKQWASDASVYQTTKKSSAGGRFLKKGFTSKEKGEKLKKTITELVDAIVKNEGDMSKKIAGSDQTLEEKFNHIKLHNAESTVIKQLDEILVASNMKLKHLIKPAPRNIIL